MDRKETARPADADRETESGRISRSGTEAGISIGSESTSGGSDPIEPGVHKEPGERKQQDKPRR